MCNTIFQEDVRANDLSGGSVGARYEETGVVLGEGKRFASGGNGLRIVGDFRGIQSCSVDVLDNTQR